MANTQSRRKKTGRARDDAVSWVEWHSLIYGLPEPRLKKLRPDRAFQLLDDLEREAIQRIGDVPPHSWGRCSSSPQREAVETVENVRTLRALSRTGWKLIEAGQKSARKRQSRESDVSRRVVKRYRALVRAYEKVEAAKRQCATEFDLSRSTVSRYVSADTARRLHARRLRGHRQWMAMTFAPSFLDYKI